MDLTLSILGAFAFALLFGGLCLYILTRKD
jgi:hypothetical protein